MSQGRTIIALIVMLVIGFSAGFVLRPVVLPPGPTTVVAALPPTQAVLVTTRSKPYFTANLDEGRRVVAGCQQGSVRGEECANAEQAVTEADGRARLKRFLGK